MAWRNATGNCEVGAWRFLNIAIHGIPPNGGEFSKGIYQKKGPKTQVSEGFPWRIHGTGIWLPTTFTIKNQPWNVGKYTSPMDENGTWQKYTTEV